MREKEVHFSSFLSSFLTDVDENARSQTVEGESVDDEQSAVEGVDLAGHGVLSPLKAPDHDHVDLVGGLALFAAVIAGRSRRNQVERRRDEKLRVN